MQKKTRKSTISKVLFSNNLEAASTLPHAKTISVYDGYKNKHIPNTAANRNQLTKIFGTPKRYDYRGKNRMTWIDQNIYK